MILNQYRNIKNADLQFSPRVNVFKGENAQGKTNFLEAIYLLSTGRSFRTSRLEEIIPWQGGRPRVKGVFRDKEDLVLEVEFQQDKRIARANGLEKTKLSGLLGLTQVVEILPQDILLIDGEPSRRRRFLDLGIAQWDAQYYPNLLRYHQALRQRNAVLQQTRGQDKEGIRMWNPILADSGSCIVGKRKKVVKILDRETALFFGGLTEKGEKAQVLYKSGFEAENPEEIRKGLLERLVQSESKDSSYGYTTAGPHRDDIEFLIEEREAKSFGSEGQKRSLMIALKLALGVLIKDVEGREPVFILDDVLTQLDERRRRGLVRALDPFQSFFSMTSAPFHQELIGEGKWFDVRQGSFEEVPGRS